MLFRPNQPFRHYRYLGDGQFEEPVDRLAICFYPEGSQNSPVSADYAARSLTRIAVMVGDPRIFGDRDELEIGGRRFEIDGLPEDWSGGPFAGLNRLFGGVIHAKRQG